MLHSNKNIKRNKMKREIIWLRISYWTAAIGDFLVAILVLIPEKNGETHYSIPMGMMASAAFSWGVLLIFSDRKPYERRWILLPTILVASLLAIVNILAVFSSITLVVSPFIRITPFIVVVALLTFSYFNARQVKQQ